MQGSCPVQIDLRLCTIQINLAIRAVVFLHHLGLIVSQHIEHEVLFSVVAKTT